MPQSLLEIINGWFENDAVKLTQRGKVKLVFCPLAPTHNLSLYLFFSNFDLLSAPAFFNENDFVKIDMSLKA